ncbi:MAG TPA: galactokinase [Solirubrobacteraceae bacterium]|nr:galactokinase [Solirubrobacteraceae bacterium]
MAPERASAFAPGRVNLIGEHTDYNDGLALPFAISQGITVTAMAGDDGRVRAYALDLGESDEFALAPAHAPGEPHRNSDPQLGGGWRAFVRGIVTELVAAGLPLSGASLEIGGDLPRGAGLSSSAALEVSLCLALLELGGEGRAVDRHELAKLCSRVENEWVGAHTGLLDQLASLYGQPDMALLIDFASLAVEPVPLELENDWRLVTLDSGEPHSLAKSGYNLRRMECAEACELLGLESLRAARLEDLEHLSQNLQRRVEHVLLENTRVRATATALAAHDLHEVGRLLNESHASLRDLYESSTPAIERAVSRLRRAGAVGARMVGGGFGGSVLGLLPPGSDLPPGAREVHPSVGAHLLS